MWQNQLQLIADVIKAWFESIHNTIELKSSIPGYIRYSVEDIKQDICIIAMIEPNIILSPINNHNVIPTHFMITFLEKNIILPWQNVADPDFPFDNIERFFKNLLCNHSNYYTLYRFYTDDQT